MSDENIPIKEEYLNNENGVSMDKNVDQNALHQLLEPQIKQEIVSDCEDTKEHKEPFTTKVTIKKEFDTNDDKICLQQFLASQVTVVKNEIEAEESPFIKTELDMIIKEETLIKTEVVTDYIVDEVLDTDDNTTDENEDKTSLQQFLSSEVTIVKNEVDSFNADSVEREANTSIYDITIILLCPLCKITFDSKIKFAKHILTHDPNSISTFNGENTLLCPICDIRLINLTCFADHVKAHKGVKKFKCNICNKLFGRKSRCQSHLKVLHSGFKEFKCDICEKSFTLKSHLNVHSRIHSGIKTFTCDTCNKTFTHRNSFKKHLKTNACGQEFIRCKLCAKSFMRQNNFDKHMLKHTKIKKFQCNICKKLFKVKPSLNKHLRKHAITNQKECTN